MNTALKGWWLLECDSFEFVLRMWKKNAFKAQGFPGWFQSMLHGRGFFSQKIPQRSSRPTASPQTSQASISHCQSLKMVKLLVASIGKKHPHFPFSYSTCSIIDLSLTHWLLYSINRKNIHAKTSFIPFKPGTWEIQRIMHIHAHLVWACCNFAAPNYRAWVFSFREQMSSSVFPLSKLGLSRNTAETYSMLYDSYDVISWQIATLNTSQLSLENISAKKLKTTHKNRHGQCDTWSSQLSQSDVGSSQHWSSSYRDQPLGKNEKLKKHQRIQTLYALGPVRFCLWDLQRHLHAPLNHQYQFLYSPTVHVPCKWPMQHQGLKAMACQRIRLHARHLSYKYDGATHIALQSDRKGYIFWWQSRNQQTWHEQQISKCV